MTNKPRKVGGFKVAPAPKPLTKRQLWEKAKKDFRVFLQMVHQHLKMEDAEDVQFDIANYLQNGPNKICIQAFRGLGKSHLTSCYVCWLLLRNPRVRILVVSAGEDRAARFTRMTMDLIMNMEILAHLKPGKEQRSSALSFDVAGAGIDQQPSVLALGIGSQISGAHCDIIVADDIEVLNNSATHDLREKLREKTKEFTAVIKKHANAKVIYLGTPQSEDSIYTKLPSTFETRIWPARIPTDAEEIKYGSQLAPFIKNLKANGQVAGSPVEPIRHSEEVLFEAELEYGKGGFALQYMLNTQLSDLERYPLKIRDLIVMDIADKVPMDLAWMPDPKNEFKALPNLAMAGDRYYSAASYSDEFIETKACVMSIDPSSGESNDETAYAVVKMVNGFLYVTRSGGLLTGSSTEAARQLAEIAKAEKVNHVIIERNFAPGVYINMIKPIFANIHPCIMEEVWHSKQKERRIIDTLEPIMARHKLIFTPNVIQDDYDSCDKYPGENKFTKSLIHQMTRITTARKALKNDDRLDALAIAVAYWTDRLAVDAEKGIAAHKSKLLKDDLREYMKGAIGGPYPNEKRRIRNAFGMGSRKLGARI